ncbi:transposase [Amycolatopsis sp. lyj-84]|uniref:transposase n=1 Tax=Amycolatopsis sp. lyj-84 TaxID=2789284 RepID=UPI003978808B
MDSTVGRGPAARPGDDAATVTAVQVRGVVDRLITAGQWRAGDPDILLIADAGYDGPRLTHVLADLPVTVLVRMRSDRVLRRPASPHLLGTMGRPRRHGGEFAFADPAIWGDPDVTTRTETRLYGPALIRVWDRLHPRLTHRIAWVGHTGNLPILGRHGDQAGGRAPAVRSDPETRVALAFPHQSRSGHSGPGLAGVPAPVRHRAHHPHAQATLGWTMPKRLAFNGQIVRIKGSVPGLGGHC